MIRKRLVHITGAVRSRVTTLPDIIQEMLLTEYSEKKGRLIDFEQVGSVERKEIERYFKCGDIVGFVSGVDNTSSFYKFS